MNNCTDRRPEVMTQEAPYPHADAHQRGAWCSGMCECSLLGKARTHAHSQGDHK